MPKISGTTSCRECGKSFKWTYQVREKLGSAPYDAVTKNDDEVFAGLLRHGNNSNWLIAHCPYCDCLNEFSHNSCNMEE